METRRWWNPSLPQTLQGAVIFLYIDALFTLLVPTVIGLVFVVADVGAAYGIVNERRWGYALGLALSGIAFLLALAFGSIIAILLAAVRLAFLLHPQSRDYQRIWFK
jgi:hypothetical protein